MPARRPTRPAFDAELLRMPPGATSHVATRWTNPSVRALAPDQDPVTVVIARARALVLDALDRGWHGPPFDPIDLARLLALPVTANSEVRDARTVPVGRDRVRIEFNPNRPRGRMRYSIAHEIAHTLFPDCAEQVRNRAPHQELQGDAWQLEALCNVAAAEVLMPIGSLVAPPAEELGIHAVLELQRRFDVSTEALMIRLAETADAPLAAFCASPGATPAATGGYRLDYLIPSRAWQGTTARRLRLPDDSVVRQCNAIGYSAAGIEQWWPTGGPTRVDAVGIPPYPGGLTPRVVGLVRPAEIEDTPRAPVISYVHGSATAPRGGGRRLVVQVVNDKTANWGGGGFASAVRTAWPVVQEDFRDWAEHHRDALRLGHVRVSRVSDALQVASIVAQRGYGPSPTPRLRYGALREGLVRVTEVACETGASVHMPRIGTGQAGGSWAVVRDLIAETLGAAGVPVTVYDLPGTAPAVDAQATLALGTASTSRGG